MEEFGSVRKRAPPERLLEYFSSINAMTLHVMKEQGEARAKFTEEQWKELNREERDRILSEPFFIPNIAARSYEPEVWGNIVNSVKSDAREKHRLFMEKQRIEKKGKKGNKSKEEEVVRQVEIIPHAPKAIIAKEGNQERTMTTISEETEKEDTKKSSRPILELINLLERELPSSIPSKPKSQTNNEPASLPENESARSLDDNSGHHQSKSLDSTPLATTSELGVSSTILKEIPDSSQTIKEISNESDRKTNRSENTSVTKISDSSKTAKTNTEISTQKNQQDQIEQQQEASVRKRMFSLSGLRSSKFFGKSKSRDSTAQVDVDPSLLRSNTMVIKNRVELEEPTKNVITEIRSTKTPVGMNPPSSVKTSSVEKLSETKVEPKIEILQTDPVSFDVVKENENLSSADAADLEIADISFGDGDSSFLDSVMKAFGSGSSPMLSKLGDSEA